MRILRRFKLTKEKTMGEHKDEQGKPIQAPGQDQPVTQPDKSNEGSNEDRNASDQEHMKKHSPSPNNPNNPNHQP